MSRVQPRAVALLWHGRGAHESAVLGGLGEALRASGLTVIAPDWDARAPDRGRAALLASLIDARQALTGSGEVIVVGWSLGGTAAVSLAAAEAPGQVGAVVGLAADLAETSPLTGIVPLRLPNLHRPVHLVHGWQDEVVPPEPVLGFSSQHECTVTMLPTSHSGVLGCTYERSLRRCVPSQDPGAVAGLAASTAAVLSAVEQRGRVWLSRAASPQDVRVASRAVPATFA